MDVFCHKRYSSHYEFSKTKEKVISTLIYEGCPVEKITYAYLIPQKQLSDIEIFFSAGEYAKWSAKIFDAAYMRQFGISVSNDGKRIFFQTWENGLYCLDAKSGEKIWRTKSKRGITNIFVNDETLCCMQREKALQLIDIYKGEIIKERKACDRGFTVTDRKSIVCQINADEKAIIDPETLDTIEVLKATEQ